MVETSPTNLPQMPNGKRQGSQPLSAVSPNRDPSSPCLPGPHETISLHSLDQTARQDGNHLILCIAALNKILQETGKGPEWPGALQSAQRVIQNANHQVGLDMPTRHQINLLDAIPWEARRSCGIPSLEQLGKAEPVYRKEMLDASEIATELENWFRKLNPKPWK